MSDPFTPIIHDSATWQRRFVIVGTRTKASSAFHLHALGDSGGRMDIMVRCMRAALLVADGIRRDTVLDLLLLAGADSPLAVRLSGESIRFLRPDERRNAILLQEALATWHPGKEMTHLAPGIEARPGGLEEWLCRNHGENLFYLDSGGPDIRSVGLVDGGVTFVVGDDRGLTQEQREILVRHKVQPLGLGPVSVHTEDAITLVHNELDRRWL
ncbi:MAG TPA: hypothetical protein PLJ27_03305 [Polyangiaceae bacterium]|jgi:tRNA (pseudouridine54-N1)-methyltransferase|nr:MAG: putative pseudouridine methyltransferase [Deltaproteobacteria bacterium ADurb.Bin207]HNS98294.1 hypothetical protein [Polyangiaceae bacterium]HNZ22703.1 hypothetical protein [Polyangiaceae bacterium]HOD24338.1 hypothetical protein [Polyangiaceae bacterium]HOE49253.1 hypothetical protein [Polyangiaceae bacterium]